jgi:hypothetical protein
MAINIESDSEERARHPEARVPHLGRAPRRIARVSKDGHKQDRASGHPRDGASRLLRMRSVGLSSIPPIRLAEGDADKILGP